MWREPFDQHSRQYYIAKLVNGSFGGSIKTIIDLGGHRGNTKQLFPTAKVTILDVFDEHYEGYIKGDATNTDFQDNQFDIATSFDVFEHIPRNKRAMFIEESLRISRLGAFMAAPVDEAGLVSGTEEALNNIYANINGMAHPWLREHIEYKIPTAREIEDILRQRGIHYCSIGSNPVTNWAAMQGMIFSGTALKDPNKAIVDVNEWYNRNIAELEADINEPTYRKVYFITNSERNLKSVQKTIKAMKSDTPVAQSLRVEMITRSLNAVSSVIGELARQNKYLSEKVALLEDEVGAATIDSQHLLSQVNEYKKSWFWKFNQIFNKIKTKLRQ